jgi:hypothetical protein
LPQLGLYAFAAPIVAGASWYNSLNSPRQIMSIITTKEFEKHRPCHAVVAKALRALTAAAVFACALASVQGHAKESTPTNRLTAYAVQILTPTEGVDFSGYVKQLMQKVRRNWSAAMPESA